MGLSAFDYSFMCHVFGVVFVLSFFRVQDPYLDALNVSLF